MIAPTIELESDLPGIGIRKWTSESILRIGRIPDFEVVLSDASLSRRHAEVAFTDDGWVVRDLGSANGTFLNATRVGRTGQKVRTGDTIKVGRIEFLVARIHDGTANNTTGFLAELKKTIVPWFDTAANNKNGNPNRGRHHDLVKLIGLIRQGYGQIDFNGGNGDMQRLLDEARALFGAQRAGLLFATEPSSPLELRFLSVAPDCLMLPRAVSKSAAAGAFERQESVLIRDAGGTTASTNAGSAKRSDTASILGAVIRSRSLVFGVLHLDRGPQQEPFTNEDLFLADALAEALAVGFERTQMAEQQQDLMIQAVTALAQAVEMRDVYTGNHTNRVTNYSLLLAEALGLPDDERKALRVSAALHDIGKIAIDDRILRKPGPLTEAEFAIMKTHVTRGAEIIETMPGLAWALPVVRSHHERWDGGGYPDGLAGENIPMCARVVAVADAFDAMTSDRPYRRGMSLDVAFRELRAGAEGQFDPACVQAFGRIRHKIESLLDEEKLLYLHAEGTSHTISVQELQEARSSVLPKPAERGSKPGSQRFAMAELSIP